MKKKFVSFALAGIIGIQSLPALAFNDIKDNNLAQKVSVLQMLGVISGTSDTTFSPDETLTRAQFCKMAVVLLGRGAEERIYRSRTIFPDVKSDHWARGYINLAVSAELSSSGTSDSENGITQSVKLMRGMADGTFRPDQPVTYAEAVTILIRMLGYSDADAGMLWPYGYLELAGSIGLTKDFVLSPDQPLTRQNAAELFYLALNTSQKSGTTYLNQLGTPQPNIIITNTNAKLNDGTSGALGTSNGVFAMANGKPSNDLLGKRGTLITNQSGKAVTFMPTGTQTSITIKEAEAAWVTDESGKRYDIPSDVTVYTPGESTTFDKVWLSLRAGSKLTLYYSDIGKIDGIFTSGSSAASNAIVVPENGSAALSVLTAGVKDYSVYRNGEKCNISDIQPYDVVTFDAASGILEASSAKITARYDDVSPSPQSPTEISVLGCSQPIKVLPMAVSSLSEQKIGDTITIFLTADGQVAGAAPSKKIRTENLAIITEAGESSFKAKLLAGNIEISGEIANSTKVQKGELVKVSSSSTSGKLYVYTVKNEGGTNGTLDLNTNMLGSKLLSANCKFFDKVLGGSPIAITRNDISVDRTNKIAYTHTDTGGKIDIIIFENVTGDAYTYGMLQRGEPQTGGDGELSYENQTVKLINHDYPTGTPSVINNRSLPRNLMGGLAYSSDGTRILSQIDLIERKNIKRSDFTESDGKTYVNLGTEIMQVSNNVQCYNRTTKKWLDSLTDARAFSDTLTVYYDRPAKDGGKIRIVVVT